ncbi:hypothetical protein BS329_38885 [Amycolatopsis coloradensis]|uniref:Uncharacterized protein n=1 Tax=Amycolatopsis coloradensis TaxID=76021 RepID=A0A1R0KES0_9PSEU|nr:hypothetical protein BS329_38885 [Amycolatopsis coloradensis]
MVADAGLLGAGIGLWLTRSGLLRTTAENGTAYFAAAVLGLVLVDLGAPDTTISDPNGRGVEPVDQATRKTLTSLGCD